MIDSRKWTPLLAHRFGFHPAADLLFKAQQQATREARANGYFRSGYNAWFFDYAENASIPSPFDVVQGFVEQLVEADLVQFSSARHLIVTESAAARQQRQTEARAARNAWRAPFEERMAAASAAAAAASHDADQALRKRARDRRQAEIAALIAEYTALALTDRNALVCTLCEQPVATGTTACTNCGSGLLLPRQLTDEYLGSLPARLDCLPIVPRRKT